MMRTITTIALFIVIANISYSQNNLVSYSHKGAIMIHDSLKQIVNKEGIPGVIAAIMDNSGVFAISSYGVRNINSNKKFTINDKIHIGSCTKSMTSAMIATLVADKILSWETTLIEVFPELSDSIHHDYHKVTLWQLLVHRSGVPANAKNWWAYTNINIKERRLMILKENLKEPSGLKNGEYLYSNLGYMIAGCMAEKLTGLTWENLMRNRLFNPLGMTSAGFGPVCTHDNESQPNGHIKLNGKWQSTFIDNAEALGSAGRVHCTIADWAKFIAMQLPHNSPSILSDNQLTKLVTPIGDYAGGWIVVEREWAQGKAFSHSGSNTTWFTTVWIAPELNRSFIVATNSCDENSSIICDKIIGQLIAIDKELSKIKNE